jgi:hypothetical protein
MQVPSARNLATYLNSGTTMAEHLTKMPISAHQTMHTGSGGISYAYLERAT